MGIGMQTLDAKLEIEKDPLEKKLEKDLEYFKDLVLPFWQIIDADSPREEIKREYDMYEDMCETSIVRAQGRHTILEFLQYCDLKDREHQYLRVYFDSVEKDEEAFKEFRILAGNLLFKPWIQIGFRSDKPNRVRTSHRGMTNSLAYKLSELTLLGVKQEIIPGGSVSYRAAYVDDMKDFFPKVMEIPHSKNTHL